MDWKDRRVQACGVLSDMWMERHPEEASEYRSPVDLLDEDNITPRYFAGMMFRADSPPAATKAEPVAVVASSGLAHLSPEEYEAFKCGWLEGGLQVTKATIESLYPKDSTPAASDMRSAFDRILAVVAIALNAPPHR